MKPLIYGSNGVANNDSGSAQGSPGLIKLLRVAVDLANPNRPMRVAHVGCAARVLPESKQGHLSLSVQRLEEASLQVVEIDLVYDPKAVQRLLDEEYDILYLNGGYPPEARRAFGESGLLDHFGEIRQRMVVAAFSASAMALGRGSLFLSRLIPEARELHDDYPSEFWWGAGMIRACVVPHTPAALAWMAPRSLIADGKFVIQCR